LAREEGETLIIGSGVPESWMSKNFEVKDMPTYFGKLSFKYSAAIGELEVNISNMPEDRIKLEFPIPVKIRKQKSNV